MSGIHAHVFLSHQNSPLHRLAPELKLVAAIWFVLAVVATRREALVFLAADTVLVGAAALAGGLSLGFWARRLMLGIPFMLFAFLLPFVGKGPKIEIGGLTVSEPGLWAAWNIVAKATLCLGAAVVMAATTPPTDVLTGLERLRLPHFASASAGFMLRYLDLILDDFRRIRIAMVSRGYRGRWFGSALALASSAGTVFIRSYERGERVYQAMVARGYAGTMPTTPPAPVHPKQLGLALSFPLLASLFAVLSWVIR